MLTWMAAAAEPDVHFILTSTRGKRQEIRTSLGAGSAETKGSGDRQCDDGGGRDHDDDGDAKGDADGLEGGLLLED
jgi:hypothetical protein